MHDDVEGAKLAGPIFAAWAQLFALGPAELDLRGLYAHIDDQEGFYERLHVDRDTLCARLTKLAGYCAEIVASDGRLYLLHMGI